MRTVAETLVAWGPAGVFLLALLDSAGIPLPATVDALLVTLSAVNPTGALVAALMAVAGSVLGSMFLFFVARKGGQAYLDRHTTTGRGAKLREWFGRYGLLTVFVPALCPIPLPLKVFILCAGALGVRPFVFFLVILAARVPRYFGLALLGVNFKGQVWTILIASLALFAVLYLALRFYGRRRPAHGLTEN